MCEILVVFAGTLGVIYLATLVIILNIHTLVYNMSYGLSQAASSQIGRTLGELGKEAAQKLLKRIVLIQVALCTLITLLYFFFSRNMIEIYTHDPLMIELFVSCTYLIILMFLLDSSQIVLGGVIRGIGAQGESSVVSFISYGIVTFPCTVVFIFYFDMKLHGVLLAYILGIVINVVFNAYILLTSEWETKIENAFDIEESDVEKAITALS